MQHCKCKETFVEIIFHFRYSFVKTWQVNMTKLEENTGDLLREDYPLNLRYEVKILLSIMSIKSAYFIKFFF